MHYNLSVERNERCVVYIRVEAASAEEAARIAEELVRENRASGDVWDRAVTAEVVGSIIDDDGTWWI